MLWIAKGLGWLLLPPGIFVLSIAASLALLAAGWRRTAAALLAATGCALYLLSIAPVSHALLRPLERHHPLPSAAGLRCDAIAVMGGGVMGGGAALDAQPQEDAGPALALPAETLSGSGLARAMTGWRLWRRLGVPLLLSGGNTWDGAATEADALAATLREWGVPGSDLVPERRSRNTFENAREAKRIVEERGWRSLCVVTSAYHLPRTVRAFRHFGIETVPVPAEGPARDGAFSAFSWKAMVPMAEHLSGSAAALREYLAFAWYRLRYGI